MENQVKIFEVFYNKEMETINNKLFVPIQAGALDNFKLNMLGDETKDNISDKNKYYAELTAQYWVWKNYDLTGISHIGFFHYRRFLNFGEKVEKENWEPSFKNFNSETLDKFKWNEEDINKFVKKYDVILPESEIIIPPIEGIESTVYEQYIEHHYFKDLKILFEVIKEKTPEYVEDFEQIFYGTKGYFCNMFLLRKDIFFEYMEWLFLILFEVEKRLDLSSDRYKGYQTRVIGYLAERLLTVFMNKIKKNNSIRLKEVQRLLANEKSLIKNYEKEFFSKYDNINPKVSIIVPIYKSEKYLRDVLESLINQTLKDIEIILVNDASPDNSIKILKEYEKIDSRVKVIDKTENQGLGMARESGMKIANGQYIKHVDPDDWFPLDMLEKLYVNAIVNGEVDIVIANHSFGTDKKHQISSHFEIISGITNLKKNPELLKIPTPVWLKLYKKDFLDKNKISFIKENGEDIHYNNITLLLADTISLLPDILYYYRIGDESLTSGSERLIKDVVKTIMITEKESLELLEENKDANEWWDLIKISLTCHLLFKSKEFFKSKKDLYENYCKSLTELYNKIDPFFIGENFKTLNPLWRETFFFIRSGRYQEILDKDFAKLKSKTFFGRLFKNKFSKSILKGTYFSLKKFENILLKKYYKI